MGPTLYSSLFQAPGKDLSPGGSILWHRNKTRNTRIVFPLSPLGTVPHQSCQTKIHCNTSENSIHYITIVQVHACIHISTSFHPTTITSSLPCHHHAWMNCAFWSCGREDSINTIRAISQRVNSPYSPSSSSKQLFHRLAISLWRGNACLWLHREHALPPSVDGII